MDRELIRDYLKRSMFSEPQAEALSNIFADLTSTFVTKADLIELKSELKSDINGLKAELGRMEARITWRLIGAMGLLAVVMTLLDRFID